MSAAETVEHKEPGAFSPFVMIALALVSVFAFAAFITLSAFAPELHSGNDARAHALSHSAIGYAGIVRLAQAQGERVAISRGGSHQSPALTIVTPEAPLTPDALNRVAGAAWLIVLPKWEAMPQPGRPDWVTRFGIYSERDYASLLPETAPGLSLQRMTGVARPLLRFVDDDQPGELRAGSIDRLQTISGEGITPIVTDDKGNIIVGSVRFDRDRALYILSDPDFLNTQGIADIDNARAGLALLDYLHDRNALMLFDVTLNGFERTRSILRLAFEPPFLAATLCLFAAALLIGWRAAVRTGPAARQQRAIALGKAALANNSAALIRLAGRETRMGPGYAALTAASAAELAGFQRVAESEVATHLDSVAAAQNLNARFSDLAADAAKAQTPQRLLEAAKKLHAWKEEMLRAIR